MSKTIFLIFICTILTLLIPSLLFSAPYLCVILMALVSLCFISTDFNSGTVKFFLFVAVFGSLSEAFAINFGAWEYQNSFFIGIPMYLPFVWGNAGLFIRYMANRIK